MKFSFGAVALLAVSNACSTVSAFSPSATKISLFNGNTNNKRHYSFQRTPFSYTIRLSGTKANVNIIEPSTTSVDTSSTTDHAGDTYVVDIASEILSLDAAKSSTASYLAKYKGQSGASIIYSKLLENGVEVVNGYSGGAVLPLLDQFHPDNPRHRNSDGSKSRLIRWITNSNESSAGHIAEGYAKSAPPNPKDGKQPAGVVVATSGPGVTNLITPLQDAICDGVPMVVLCGQAATTAPPDAFQFAPAVDLTTPCTKWSYQIKSAAELPFVMDYAFFLSRNGRPGPVFVDLPKDLQNQVLDDSLIEKFVTSIPIKSNENKSMNKDDISMTSGGIARFVPRYTGTNGERAVSEHVIHLGHAERGLSFTVSEDGKTIQEVNDISLQGDDERIHQKDHTPADKIYCTGQQDKFSSDDLSVESDLTRKVFDLIVQAKKPLIIAGQGCNNCPGDLKEFSEALQIPVATTLHALGCFDERSSLALNMVGMHGHPTPNYMTQESDLIICVGSRFDDRITGKMSEYIPVAKEAALQGKGGVIHVDVRLSEKAKQVKPTYFVHSTAKTFLRTMNDHARKRKEEFISVTSPENRKIRMEQWLTRKAYLQESYPVNIPCFPQNFIRGKDENGNDIIERRTLMTAQSVVAHLNHELHDKGIIDDCLFSTGVGIHQMVAAQLLTWTQPRQMVTSGSLGTMGVALGFVIGCKLANGKKICIAIDGDGSFNMTFTELKTVAEEKIPIKIMILDNESQMMVEYWQRLFHEERYLAVTNSANPNYGKLADAFGIKNLYCDCQEDLPEKMRQFLFDDPDKPVLFHVRIERTPCLPLVAPGKALQEMILEDVFYEGLDACSAPS